MRSTLITLAILLCVGCGTRKATVNLSKTDVKEEYKEVSSGNTSTSSTSTGSTETSEQVAKTDEKQESRTRELYDENGKLKERITELINSKSADKSKRSSVGRYDINTNTNTAYTNTIYRTVTISDKDKSKATDTNNKPLYWMIFGVVAFGILVYGGYKLLTRV